MRASVMCLLALAVTAAEGRQENVFRARTDAVVVSVAVRARNRPVSGLTAADFELQDNGVAQELSSTSAEKVPVDVTLVVDTSGSISGAAFDRLKADIQAIANLLTRDDRVRLMTFATRTTRNATSKPNNAWRSNGGQSRARKGPMLPRAKAATRPTAKRRRRATTRRRSLTVSIG